MPPDLDNVKEYLLSLQASICEALEAEDRRARFSVDEWKHGQGGGGKSRVLAGGAVFEKAGVNFSHVTGKQLPPSATATRPELAGRPFHATGVSLVIHPINPYVPIAHANIRFLLVEKTGDKPSAWWFGGGMDLTPCYGFVEDAVHWHQTSQRACLPFGPDLYPRFKAECDRYFFIRHRNETRGIGGIFFDDFREGGFDNAFGFARSIGDHFVPAYIPIVQRRKEHSFGEKQKNFQLYRRGRYVEFNLVYDRGTLFGLQSGGRIESILMSMPPLAAWQYNYQPEDGSDEARLTEYFLRPRDWLNLDPAASALPSNP